MEPEPKPVIVIVGPTASGKSALAMQVALQPDGPHTGGPSQHRTSRGEIICADSRTIYKDMDIGTAKSPIEDRAIIPHHGLNLISPDETFSAAEFQRYTKNKVAEIQARGKLPIIVGGTGLYIDGYVYDFEFGNKADEKIRTELEKLNLEQLQKRANEIGIDPADVNFANPRHLARAIERGGTATNRKPKPANVYLFGIQADKPILHDRIEHRVDTMFNEGLVDEVQKLIKKYGSDAPGLLAPGYKAVKEYLEGTLSLDEAKERFITNDKRLAKRQMTWFSRNKDINWCKPNDLLALVDKFLVQ